MHFQEPFKLYTAGSNVEAHMIVQMLETHGVAAFADEDQSAVTARIGHLHQAHVWVEKSAAQTATELIDRYELTKLKRANPEQTHLPIEVTCEECGKSSTFPSDLNGTVQQCPHCRAYMDVGELDWDEDFGVPEGE